MNEISLSPLTAILVATSYVFRLDLLSNLPLGISPVSLDIRAIPPPILVTTLTINEGFPLIKKSFHSEIALARRTSLRFAFNAFWSNKQY